MKGLEKTPTLSELTKAYNIIQTNPLSEKILLKYFQWVRFDPRLGEILIQKIIKDWHKLNPLKLYEGLQHAIWPQVMGVLLDMADLGIIINYKAKYHAWKSCVLHRVPRQSFQQFTIGLTSFAGVQTQIQLVNSNKIFLKWNYYNTGLFFNKEKLFKTNKTLLKKNTRMALLKEFLNKNTSFTVNDYLAFLPSPVSRRLAELDLKNHPNIKTKGHTRKRIYYIVPNEIN